MRQVKPCNSGRCNATQKPRQNSTNSSVDMLPSSKFPRNEMQDSGFRILYNVEEPALYSEWGEWSPCSDKCVTNRNKTCIVEDVCGQKILQETTICFVEGSACQEMYGTEQDIKSGSAEDISRYNPLDNLQCGITPPPNDIRNHLRIIGGREARKGSWPWQLAVLNRHQKEDTEQEKAVAEQFVHPNYDEDVVHNDIALLKLRTPFIFDNYTQPACLPDQEPPQVHTRGIILGWGKHASTAIFGTDRLHQAEVPIVDANECRKSYAEYPLSKTMLCAGYKEGGVDSCAGDSGGPLLMQVKDRWTLYGVTSFGDGCGEKGKFGIYSSVPHFVKWIRKTIQINS
ncbi:plasma kallikrein [Caerostris extrusa]|uniref:Vitamin K-dependent protein C n=1 Tax=Caerostris extrusa TaxID=172846 RepID=A0AAV4UCS9_CAEEX|nr:plasma kallikrein [Caerostris extrusa]